MENCNKKIKFKVSLAGIEFEASGYGSEEASKMAKKILTIISVSLLVGFLIKIFL